MQTQDVTSQCIQYLKTHSTVCIHLHRLRRCQMTHTTPQKILQHTYTIPSSERMIDNAGKCTHCLKSITLSLHISIVRDDARRLIQCPEILQCAYTIPSSERMIDNAGQCTHCLKQHYTVFTHLHRPRRCQTTHTTP